MNYKNIKNEILTSLQNKSVNDAKILISKIENTYKNDVDIIYFNAYISFLEGNIDKSYYLCKKALSIVPLNFSINELLMHIYRVKNDFEQLNRLLSFFFNILLVNENTPNKLYASYDIFGYCNYIIDFFRKNNMKYDSSFLENVTWGRPINEFINKVINNFLFTKPLVQQPKFFDAFYNNLKIQGFKIYSNEYLNNDKNYILPIYSYEKKNVISIYNKNEDKDYKFILDNIHYYLFNINGIPNLKSNSDLFIGKPIPCFKFENNKDLVLTLFIDGLSQRVIEENGGLENLMPHTHNFFKDYMYCNNFYTSGEWTYVSIASYFTGQYTTSHKLFHPNFNITLRDDVKILSEYINDKNYFTSKIDGDWRSNFAYGYYRGFDHILYEPSNNGNMTIKDLPSLLIEHIETFKNTNMFIHTCIPDLHDTADGYNLTYPIQAIEPYDEKPISVNFISSETSVKTEYSEARKNSYIRIMKYIDIHLRSIYCYLEDNFDLDNITVALISDHGQGFLVKPDEEFLSDGRVKVPLLIRSKETKNMKCDELVQNVDYIAIMDKILGLNVNYRKIDANLPACLGGKEREYAYSESLFPGDPYRALINMKDCEFFFESKENVEQDGRVILDEYRTHLKDKNTREDINDNELLKKCINIVFEHMKYNRIYI